MALAGTSNALRCPAHSGANAIGNVKTQRESQNSLNHIYESPIMIDCLQSSLTESLQESFNKIPAEKQQDITA